MRIKDSWPVALFAVMATAVTWPAIRFLNSAIPLGSESAPTVPLFNLWTMSWNVNRLLHGYQGYWNAPIFYPASGTFAFSDPQPITGLLASVFWSLGSAAAYNLVLLLFLTLNGWAAFALLRRRGLAVGMALFGGLLMQMLPFLAHERGVLQLQPIFGVLWAVDGLWQLADHPRWRWAVQMGLGVAITFLTSEYYALFLVLMLAAALPFLPPIWRERRFWTAVWPSFIIAVLLIAPVALPQMKAVQAMGFSRSVRTITANSASLAEYGRLSPTLRNVSWIPWQFKGDQTLFPGISLLIMAFLGFYSSRRQRWAWYLATGMAVAWLLSFGFNLKLAGWQPYALVRDFIPGFDNLRSPFRWGYFVQIYLALLAVLFLDKLWQYGRRWWSFGLMVLVLIEVMPASTQLTAVPPPINIETLNPPLLFLPFADSGATAAYADTADWMTTTSAHSAAMVNGYSGYFPQMQGQLRTLLADFPTLGGMAVLRSLGVKTILIASDSLTPEQLPRLAEQVAEGYLIPAAPLDGFLVYELTNAQLNLVDKYDGSWALEGSVEGEELVLWAYAAVPDAQIYIADPVLSPLNWQITWWGDNGRFTTHLVSLQGTNLLYHGSDRRLRLAIPRPQASGSVTVTLQNLETGQLLGRTSVTIP